MQSTGNLKWLAMAALIWTMTACGSTESCPIGFIDCEGTCVDTRYDLGNCGACGVACAAGELCGEGACIQPCAGSLVDCNGTCVDPFNDNTFCGASGNCQGLNAGTVCQPGEVCGGAGVCQLTCQDGLIDCNGTCIDPRTDESYCGATADCQGVNAGTTCAAGEVCDGMGACALGCQDGMLDCNGTCVDPMSDEGYCGATTDCLAGNAGTVCGAGEACVAGACELQCPTGLVLCGGACVDALYDPGYCGATADCMGANAGQACGGSQYCDAGTCEDIPLQDVLMPPQTGTFSSSVRGFWFTAQTDFTIVGLRVPNDIAGAQSLHLMRFNSGPPPLYSASTTDYTTLAYIMQDASTDFVTVNAPVSAGDIIGVLGQRGTTTSYGASPATVTIDGVSTTLTRLLFQGPINTGPAGAVSTENGGSLGRIDLRIIP